MFFAIEFNLFGRYRGGHLAAGPSGPAPSFFLCGVGQANARLGRIPIGGEAVTIGLSPSRGEFGAVSDREEGLCQVGIVCE